MVAKELEECSKERAPVSTLLARCQTEGTLLLVFSVQRKRESVGGIARAGGRAV